MAAELNFTGSSDELGRILSYTDAGFSAHQPTPRQHAGLLLPQREVLYGGAAGGGKSDWLLMAALQYVHVPGYSALLLRRTFPQLTKADSLIPRSREWLTEHPGMHWSDKYHRWTFPSGATLEFGHLQYEGDKYNYQGAAYQFIGWDELTQFNLTQYQYLFSRARRPKDASRALSQVPIRIRAGSNPGGTGHAWVKQRFIGGGTNSRAYLPAKLKDNPHLDQKEYIETLMELDPITRKQLLDGDWAVRQAGGYFKREWIKEIIDVTPTDCRDVRFWDLAATEPKKGKDPDWTVGTKVAKKENRTFIGPLIRKRTSPQGVDAIIKQTAAIDGMAVPIRIEQEGGASGKIVIAHYQDMLPGYDVRGIPATGDKLVRFGPFSSQSEAGNVSFINGPWIPDCFDELEALGDDASHDDQADSIAGGYNFLSGAGATWGDVIGMMGEAA